MSEENVDLFLAAAESFNRGDIDGAMKGISPDYVFEPQVAVIEGKFVGHDGLLAFLQELADVYEVFQLHYSDVRDLGDKVLALGTANSIAKSGIAQEWSLAVVATFKDGLETHWKDYGDRGEALKAVGLSE